MDFFNQEILFEIALHAHGTSLINTCKSINGMHNNHYYKSLITINY